jgi:hypothetical protein
LRLHAASGNSLTGALELQALTCLSVCPENSLKRTPAPQALTCLSVWPSLLCAQSLDAIQAIGRAALVVPTSFVQHVATSLDSVVEELIQGFGVPDAFPAPDTWLGKMSPGSSRRPSALERVSASSPARTAPLTPHTAAAGMGRPAAGASSANGQGKAPQVRCRWA